MKSFSCKDVGMQCDWNATAENETDMLKKIEEHARNQHNMPMLSGELRNKVSSVIKDFKAA